MEKKKSYKGYTMVYDISKSPLTGKVKIVEKGATKIITTVESNNETALIKMFHDAVNDYVEGKTIDTYITDIERKLPISKPRDEYAPVCTNFIVGDILAPRLSDIIIEDDCFIITHHNGNKASNYTLVHIDDNGKAKYSECTKEDLQNNYKIIGRVTDLNQKLCTLKAKEDAIRNDYLYYRSSITDAIDRFDKSDEEVSEDLINFLRSTTDISETAREQFLKLLMS